MYQKVSTNLNFVDREKETEKFWRENDIFQKSMKAREGCPTYTRQPQTASRISDMS
jgi:isoleucyl-tRNA synthetase